MCVLPEGLKKKQRFMGMKPVNNGVMSVESAAASEKRSYPVIRSGSDGIEPGGFALASVKPGLMEEISSVNAGKIR